MSIDLEEQAPDAQRHAVIVGKDNLDLLHSIILARDGDIAPLYRVDSAADRASPPQANRRCGSAGAE